MAQQGFPNLSSRLVDENGAIATPWHRLFIELWNRTGGSSASITNLLSSTAGGFVSPDDGLLSALMSDADAAVFDAFSSISGVDQSEPRDDDQCAIALSMFDLPDAKASKPAAVKTITVGASPFAYAATADGDAYLDGGTGLSIALARQGASFTLAPTSGFFPLSPSDVLTVTYSTAPRFLFIPRIA